VATLTPGQRLGPYEILAQIGAGGMGEVWKARDTRLDRVLAIKTSKAEFSERFAREAKAIAALNHPHICQLYDVGPDYLVMEYVEGSPLKGPLPMEKAVEYAGQILGALDAAHRKGITHRDLKPANIMVTKQHGIKLLDFGLARIAAGSGDSTLTQPGEKMGTPAYMAPEQWEGKPGDARTDIYCFGCVLYEMLTGKRAAQEGRPPVKWPPLEGVIATCMKTDPEERWQSARDIREAMTLPTPSVPKQRPLWPWIAAAGVFAVLAAAAWLFRSPAATERSYRRTGGRWRLLGKLRARRISGCVLWTTRWRGGWTEPARHTASHGRRMDASSRFRRRGSSDESRSPREPCGTSAWQRMFAGSRGIKAERLSSPNFLRVYGKSPPMEVSPQRWWC